MDGINLLRLLQHGVRHCCIPIFTEALLADKILECGIELEGLTLHRANRVTVTSVKHFSGGLAIYTNADLFIYHEN